MTEKTHGRIFRLLIGWIIPIADIAVPLVIVYTMDCSGFSIFLATVFSIVLELVVHKIIDWELKR